MAAKPSVVEVEHALHQLPFAVGGSVGVTTLEAGNERFPFSLAGKGGETCHGSVPVEIIHCVHDHEQLIAEDIDLHLQDTYFADTVAELLKLVFFRMAFPIEPY